MSKQQVYLVSTQNKDKKPNETHVYRHPLAEENS